MDYFYSNLHNAVNQTEPENGGGEITVRLPSETMPLIEGMIMSFKEKVLSYLTFNLLTYFERLFKWGQTCLFINSHNPINTRRYLDVDSKFSDGRQKRLRY